MRLDIEQEMIEPIVRDHIAAAIVSQIGDPEDLIRRMVNLALSAKVASDGKVSKYSSDNKFDFIEALCGKAIREAATEAIQRIVEEQKPAIEAAIVKQLQSRPKQTAAAIVAGFVESASSKYRISATFQFSGIE